MFSQSQNWWRTNGNTPQSTDYLGTSNNSPLIIKTNSTERVRIAPNGFVGINTANPQYVLDVNGRAKLRYNVYCDSLLQASHLIVNYSIQTSTIDAQVYLLNGQPAVFSQWTSISPNAIAFNGDVYVNTLNAQSGISIGNFRFKNGATAFQRDTIKSDKMVSVVADKSIEFRADTVRFAEKVGIGKQPLVALDVNGDVAVSGSLKVGNLAATQDSVLKVVVVDNSGNLQTLGGPGNPPPAICPTPMSSPYWYIGGNKLPAAGCNYIGSANGVGFSVISGGVPRINFSPTGEIGFRIAPPPAAPSGLVDPVVFEFNGSVSVRNDGNASLFFGREHLENNTSSVARYYGEWGIQYVPADPANNVPVGGLNFWKPYQSTGTAGNYFLFLRDDGKVQIGSMTQSASSAHNDFKLSVDGKLVARKVITTQLNWADDEWNTSGSLEQLQEEVEYAYKNKHLRDVPDEEEITKNGIDVGDMQRIQMREIEKLYKYVYELMKENELLKEEIKKIKDHKN
ncbi:MAG: hypothetical protein Fur0023_05820 [Bacteroidia bacterium]